MAVKCSKAWSGFFLQEPLLLTAGNSASVGEDIYFIFKYTSLNCVLQKKKSLGLFIQLRRCYLEFLFAIHHTLPQWSNLKCWPHTIIPPQHWEACKTSATVLHTQFQEFQQK